MHLSRILIENFRNFSKLDVALDGNVVVVGENKVGKSNLMHALRLLFDPSLPDSARELGLADFWDGLVGPEEDDKIVVAVEIEEFDETTPTLTVGAVIWVERQSHKPIVIGKRGDMLKTIGKEAREDMQVMLERPVYLRLWVKVRDGWADDERALRQLGYNEL